MNRYLLSLLISATVFGASAQTFEKVIENQPPEVEKNFWGITDNILSKTENLLDGLTGIIEGFNKSDLSKIFENFNKSADTFKKYRAEHKVALEKQLNLKEQQLATIKSTGAKGAKLANAYLELGRAANAAADFDKARSAYAEALKIADTNPEPSRSLQYDVLLAMADCAYDSYDTDYMLTVRDQLEKLATNASYGSINQQVNAKLASARSDMRIGYHEGAINGFNQAYNLAFSEKSKNFDVTDPIFNRLQVDLLQKFSDLGMAEECIKIVDNFVGYQSSLESYLNPEIVGKMYMLRANCQSLIGNNGNALEDISRSLKIIQKQYPNGSVAEMESLITLGDILRRNELVPRKRISHHYADKGATYYLNGCRILATRIWGDEKNNINPWLRRINSKLALATTDDYRKHHEKMKEGKAPSLTKRVEVAANKSTYTSDENLYLKHEKLANSSLDFTRKIYKQELEYLRDKIRTDFLTMDESQRANYMVAMSELVNDIYNFAEIDRKHKDTDGMVYNATLLNKSVLLSFSRSLGTAIKAMNDPQLTARLDELNAKRKEYVRLEQEGDFTLSAEIRKEAGEIERALQKAVSSTDPGAFVATTWKDVKKALGKNDAAVEFYTFTENTNGNLKLRERMVAIAANKDPKVYHITYKPGVEVKYSEPLQRNALYYSLWEPLEKDKVIKAGGSVFFAPAGRWNSVPLEYLPTGKEGMNDRYRMVRVSTTRHRPATTVAPMTTPVLFGGLNYNLGINDMKDIRAEIAESGMRGANGLGIWNNLPGTETEVNDIASILAECSDNCALVTGDEGIEESFKALSGGNYGIVHIATHGYYNPSTNEHPFRSQSSKMDEAMDNSGLVFSGANQYLAGIKGSDGLDNGLLTAREIALMDLSSTDLVVMSACETGAGQATAEGVMGLQRGFKLAGANTLVMSLWKVNDQATAAMMSAFYRHLAAGKDKRTAFYEARAELRKGTYKDAEGKDVSGTDPLIGDAFVIMD